MSGHSISQEPFVGPQSAVAVALHHLTASGDLPTLADLDAGTIAGFRDLPHVQAVSVITEAEGAGLLDPGRARCTQASVGEWTRGGEETLHHLSRTLQVRNRPFVTVRLGLDVDPAEVPGLQDSLDQYAIVIEGAASFWAEAVAARSESRRVAAENEALDRLNRLQARFTAMTSHELKTPLTSITAYADVLRSLVPAEQVPQAAEFLSVIQSESARLLRMVNRILDFSRIESQDQLLKRTPEALDLLVADVVRSLRPVILGKSQTCEVEVEPDLARAMIDSDLVRQVLVNLIGNAVKFTPEGGRIRIRIEEAAASLRVRVLDSGPGIPPEDIRRIFREFYRARGETAEQEGSGLGLSIAQRIVHLHDGTIHAERLPGGGTEFNFEVPKQLIFPVPLPEEYGARLIPGPALRLVQTLVQTVAEITDSRVVTVLLRNGFGELIPVAANSLRAGDGYPAPVPEDEAWSSLLERGGTSRDGDGIRLPWNPLGPGSQGELVYAALGEAERAIGALILGRRNGDATYDTADLDQVAVLAELCRLALDNLHRWGAGPQPEESAREIERTTAALRILLRIRRTGVPTATPQALYLVRRLGEVCGLSATRIRHLQHAAALHDAGMAHIEDEILLGETDLSYDERDEIDLHVEQGVEAMEPLLADAQILEIIRHHHERFDGTGYPDGLAATDIPLESRLLAVIDAWFSLTRGRPYRAGLPAIRAIEEIQAHSGSQFDATILHEFRCVLEEDGILSADDPDSDPGQRTVSRPAPAAGPKSGE